MTTINLLTALGTTPASNDLIPVWDTSAAQYKQMTTAQLLALYVTGGGVVATGGHTLTVSKDATINGSLAGDVTGGGTLATGGFNLTVPATGTAALLGTAQTITALKTFSAGINLGDDTLSKYKIGVWTPVLRFGGASTGITYATQAGTYHQFGNLARVYCNIGLSSKGSATGTADISGQPFPCVAAEGPHFDVRPVATATSYVRIWAVPGASTLWSLRATTAASTGGGTTMADTDFANNTSIIFWGWYRWA